MLNGGISVVIGLCVTLLGFGVIGNAIPYQKFYRYGGPIIAICGLIVLLAAAQRVEPVDTNAIVAEIKKRFSFPVRVDATTQLDDIRAMPGKEIQHRLTITNITKAELANRELASLLEKNLRGGACQNQDYRTMFESGIRINLSYQTVDQAKVVEVVLLPSDCGF